MISCKEFALEDLMAIVAIPLDKYIPTGTSEIEPTLEHDDFEPVIDDDAITIGSVAPVGALIPIMLATGKVKDSTSDSVAGRLHTVAVSCEIDQRDSDVWALLLRLERTPRHLIITSRDGTRFFAQATRDTYLCNTDRDGSKTTVSFTVKCLMGLQEIV